MREFAFTKTEVQANVDQACLGDAPEYFDDLAAVGDQERDPIARLQTPVDECVCDLVAA